MNRSNKFTTGLNMDRNILYYLQYFNIICYYLTFIPLSLGLISNNKTKTK